MFKNIAKNIIIKIILIALIFILVYPTVTFAATESVSTQIKKNVLFWYTFSRYFAISGMLALLIYLGIRLAIASVASEKAMYKKMILDWLSGMLMIFIMHYFMIFILKINSSLIEIIKKASGIENREIGLYETVRTNAYSLKFTVGTTGAIMYMYLIYYTIKYLFIYIKRYINIVILTVSAPIICMFNTFKKVNTGKANQLSKWFEEYIVNVLIQVVHVLVYILCVGWALELTEESFLGIAIALAALGFMSKADKLFRQIFKLSGNGGPDGGIKDLVAPFKATKAIMTGQAVKGVTDVVGKKVKKKGGEFIDSKIEKILDKKRDKISDNDIKEKENKIQTINDEINRHILDKKKQAEELEKDGKISTQSKFTDKEIAEKMSERQKLTEELANLKKIKYDYTERDENGNVRTIKRSIEYDVNGNEIGGRSISRILVRDFENKIFGSQANKQSAIKLAKTGVNAITGMGKMFVSIPLLIDEPAVGMMLLSSGIKNTKPVFKRPTTNVSRLELAKLRSAKLRRQKKIKNIIENDNVRINQVHKNNVYTFNRFNKTSVYTIKSELENRNTQRALDNITRIIGKLDSPTLSVRIFSAPLRLTGQTRIAQNLGNFVLNEFKQKEKREIKIDRNYAVQLVSTVSREYMQEYKNQVHTIDERVKTATPQELIVHKKEHSGKIREISDGRRIQFSVNRSILEKGNKIDQILIDVAVELNVSNISELNLNDKKVLANIAKRLDKNKFDEQIKELVVTDKTTLIKALEERKAYLEKSKVDLVKERFIENAIVEMLTENNNVDIETLSTEEGKKLIEEKVLEIFGNEEISQEENVTLMEDITSVLENSKIIERNEDIEFTEEEQDLIQKFEGFVATGVVEKSEPSDSIKEDVVESIGEDKIASVIESIGEDKIASAIESIGEDKIASVVESIRAGSGVSVSDFVSEAKEVSVSDFISENKEASVEDSVSRDTGVIFENPEIVMGDGETQGKPEFLDIIAELRKDMKSAEVTRMNDAVVETVERIKAVERNKEEERTFEVLPTITPKKISEYDGLIEEKNKEYSELLSKIIEQKEIEEEAELIGIRKGTKEQKKMQMIYDEQTEKTVHSGLGYNGLDLSDLRKELSHSSSSQDSEDDEEAAQREYEEKFKEVLDIFKLQGGANE